MTEQSAEQTKKAKESADKVTANSSMMDAISKTSGIDQNGEPSDGQGDGSMGSLLEIARAARHEPKDWRTELMDFATGMDRGERVSTFARVNRRGNTDGVIRPGHKFALKPRIGVILDTSGSMWDELPTLMVELEALSDSGYSFDVICCDGDVYGPQHFDAGEFDWEELRLDGGGGSNMHAPFERLKEMCPEVDAIVFCTDGMIIWPKPDILGELPPSLLVCTTRRYLKGCTNRGFAKGIYMEC